MEILIEKRGEGGATCAAGVEAGGYGAVHGDGRGRGDRRRAGKGTHGECAVCECVCGRPKLVRSNLIS